MKLTLSTDDDEKKPGGFLRFLRLVFLEIPFWIAAAAILAVMGMVVLENREAGVYSGKVLGIEERMRQ